MAKPKPRKKPKGLPKRTGKASSKMKRDRSFSTLPERKLRRILASNGQEAAERWAREHEALRVLGRLLAEKGEPS